MFHMVLGEIVQKNDTNTERITDIVNCPTKIAIYPSGANGDRTTKFDLYLKQQHFQKLSIRGQKQNVSTHCVVLSLFFDCHQYTRWLDVTENDRHLPQMTIYIVLYILEKKMSEKKIKQTGAKKFTPTLAFVRLTHTHTVRATTVKYFLSCS